MKSPILRLSLALLCCGSIFFSCRSDLAGIKPEGGASSRLVKSAQEWYADHRDTNARHTILPDWELARTLVATDGDHLLVAPGPEVSITGGRQAFSHSHFFVFESERGRISQGRFVVFHGRNYSVEQNIDHLLANYDQPVIPGFTGSLIQYDMDQQPVESAAFENGHKSGRVHIQMGSALVEDVEELLKPVRSEEELNARLKRLQERADSAKMSNDRHLLPE